MNALCQNIHLITNELFSIVSEGLDYKQKITIIQFIIDLMWNLKKKQNNGAENGDNENKMEVDEVEDSQLSIDFIMQSLTNLFKVNFSKLTHNIGFGIKI